MVGSRRTQALATVVAVLSLGMAGGAAASPAPSSNGDRVKIIGVFEDSVSNPRAAAQDIERRHNGRLSFVYEHALKGFAGEFPQASLSGLQRDPRVDYIEMDQVVSIAEQQTPTGVDRVSSPVTLGLASTHWTVGSGDAVDAAVAVIDTGIDHNHPDLNVVGGADCTGGGPFSSSCKTALAGDGNGHGTHVAGTIAAKDNSSGVIGVAPGARLYAVKVLRNDGSGYMSWIAAGVDWVTKRAPLNNGEIGVANMSLGCKCTSSVLDTALNGSVDKGVTHVVAAGNSDLDLKDNAYSPARHPRVITVSALDDFDGKSGSSGGSKTCSTNTTDDHAAYFTNFDSSGKYIDVTAPGVCILSTVPNGGYAIYSGTSMASPHVAGAATLLASNSAYLGKPGEIEKAIEDYANSGWTESKDSIKEPLLDVSNTVFSPTLAGGGDIGETNAPPSASFTHSCSELTCSFRDTSTDTDGTIASRSWAFGDGGLSTATDPSHTYSEGGSYTVSLTVTDDDGDTDMTSQSVSVSSGATAAVTVGPISPATISVGTNSVEISGTGFATGASVTLQNGKGHTPTVVVGTVSATSVLATITVEAKGPSADWDVRVTNPDGTSGVCSGCLRVNR